MSIYIAQAPYTAADEPASPLLLLLYHLPHLRHHRRDPVAPAQYPTLNQNSIPIHIHEKAKPQTQVSRNNKLESTPLVIAESIELQTS